MKTKFSGILTLLLAFVVQLSFAQGKTISGTISDGDNLPLPGVNVVVKGTSNGTTTDFDGNYSITANTGDVLVFSYVGNSEEKTVGASSNISFVMMSENVLDEVVITAFGIKTTKRELTSQQEIVDSEKLTVAQPTSVASALTGKVAGLQINNLNNGVKPSTNIVLRGLRSISGENSALIVIDGSIATQGAFDALNPNDVQELNVLKGAAAAVLYGSNASNGAIIVTTKTGEKGKKFTVGINSTSTMEEVAYMPQFQTEYGTGWQGVYDNIENTNWGPRFDGTVRPVGPVLADGSQQMLPYAPVKDNLLDFYETGHTLQNTIYFSGASESASYYVSIGDQRTKGIVPGDTYKKNTFRINASQELGNINLSANVSYFRDDADVVNSSIVDDGRGLYWFLLNTPANIPLTNYKNWQSDKFASPDGYYNGYYQNPYWAIDTARDTDVSDRINGNISGSWDALSWLNITARLGLNKTSGQGKQWRRPQTYTNDYTRPDAVSSFVTDSEYQSLQFTTDVLVTGDWNLNQDLSLKAIVGATNFTSKYRTSALTASNLSIPGFYDISNGTGELAGAVDETEKKTYGFLSKVTLGFKEYLYLELSGRQDYTSTLRDGDNSYFYPGIGISSVLTDAIPSLKSDVISFAQITANNSTVYNDLGAYQINERYSQPTYFPYGGNNGFTLGGTAVDENIKKEKINTTEFGLNMRMFRNRLRMTASYYKTLTTDLITATTPSVTSGASSYLTNIGELEGKGFELSLGGTVLKANDFTWDVDVNYSTHETTVNEIKDGITETNVQNSALIYAVVGEAFPQLKTVSYDRDPNGRIIIDPTTGNPLIGDLKSQGKTTPDYVIGLSSTLNYKGFTLATTLDYRTGHVYYSSLADNMEFTGRSLESVSSNRQDFIVPNSVYNTGTAANPVYVANTNIPVTGGRQSYWTDHYNNIKENYVRDATALKIREVALSYSLPSDFIKNSALSKVSIGLVARNLLTWLPEENRFSDPEFNNTSNNVIGVGGFTQAPPTRSFGVNLNVEF